MKWAFIIFFILYFKPAPVCSQISMPFGSTENSVLTSLNIPGKSHYKSNLLLIQYKVTQRTNFKDSIGKYVTFLLLGITTLLTILTPLILIYFWIYYSVEYVKKYRHIFGIKQWIFRKTKLKDIHQNNKIRQSYSKVYSLMIGFGVSILAYSISSIRFMVLNFEEMHTALIQYFSFPFLALDEFGLMEHKAVIDLKFEYFWNQMLLIVIISVIFFLIGYLIGSLIVDLRFKFINKQVQKYRKTIKAKKEMFSLKTKITQSIRSEAETLVH